MSLTLVVGASGTGKTEKIYHDLIASAIRNPDVRHIMLVPEQFTMQTQRRLVSCHPGHGLLNIDIVSFDRLAYRVLDETGAGSYQLLDDTGKSMLLRRSAGERRKELGIFSGNLSRSGFISRMRSMVSELFEYNVDVKSIEKLAEELKNRPVLSGKLKDISVFYEAFSEKLGSRTIPAEELLPILSRMLPESSFLRGAVVAVDDFTGFTQVQYGILSQILEQCRSITVSVTLPRESNARVIRRGELFSLSKSTIQQLLRLADESGITAKTIRLPEDGGLPYRFRGNPALGELERNFLRRRNRKKDRAEDENKDIIAEGTDTVPDKKVTDFISFLEAHNPQEEAVCAAARIHWLVKNRNFRYRDIAVIVPDLDRYRQVIAQAFDETGILYFMDRKKGLASNPLIELVRSALQVLLQNFSYDSVFRYLKCGLASLQRDEIDQLENYVRAAGIRGVSSWKRLWDRKYKGVDELDFDELNRYRILAAAPLIAFREKEKGTVADFTEGIRWLVEELGAIEKMSVWADAFAHEGNDVVAQEYAKAGEALRNILDMADSLLGEERMSVREFAEMLDAGIDELQLGSLPHLLDQVQVGDINRSRLTELKVVFFLGMNDDILPAKPTGGMVLTEEEREILKGRGLSLAPTQRELADQEKFYLYRIMTKPSEFLYLSWSKFTSDGKSNRPSRYVTQIMKLFPDGHIEQGRLSMLDNLDEASSFEGIATSPASARRALAESASGIRDGRQPSGWTELYSVLKRCSYEGSTDDAAALSRIVEGLFPRSGKRQLDKALDVIYGRVLPGSISQLESFVGCPYSYFLKYDLRLTQRSIHEFDPIDRGNFFHIALQTFFVLIEKEHLSLDKIDEQTRLRLTEESVVEAISQTDPLLLKETARSRYYVRRWRQMTERTLWAVVSELLATGFRPAGTELAFTGRELGSLRWKLGSKEMVLRGRIDRLDICSEGGRTAYRVVDYKTGNKNLELNEIDMGRSLQLPIYLSAAEEILRRAGEMKVNLSDQPDGGSMLKEASSSSTEILPAGLYYYKVQDPVISTEKFLDEDELEAKLLSELKLRGLKNADDDISAVQEKKGRKEAMADTGQMRSMMEHARKKAGELGKEILSGRIDTAPVRDGADTQCDFCDFRSVCGFDPKLPGFRYQRIKKTDSEEIWERWREEKNSGNKEQK